jgi:hypothetical protein
MSFFKNLGKKKVRFDFHILICGLHNLPKSLEGVTLQCQIKRKEKVVQTALALVTNGSANWDEPVSFYSSLFLTDKHTSTYDSKVFIIGIKGVGDDGSDKWRAPFDVARLASLCAGPAATAPEFLETEVYATFSEPLRHNVISKAASAAAGSGPQGRLVTAAEAASTREPLLKLIVRTHSEHAAAELKARATFEGAKYARAKPGTAQMVVSPSDVAAANAATGAGAGGTGAAPGAGGGTFMPHSAAAGGGASHGDGHGGSSAYDDDDAATTTTTTTATATVAGAGGVGGGSVRGGSYRGSSRTGSIDTGAGVAPAHARKVSMLFAQVVAGDAPDSARRDYNTTSARVKSAGAASVTWPNAADAGPAGGGAAAAGGSGLARGLAQAQTQGGSSTGAAAVAANSGTRAGSADLASPASDDDLSLMPGLLMSVAAEGMLARTTTATGTAATGGGAAAAGGFGVLGDDDVDSFGPRTRLTSVDVVAGHDGGPGGFGGHGPLSPPAGGRFFSGGASSSGGGGGGSSVYSSRPTHRGFGFGSDAGVAGAGAGDGAAGDAGWGSRSGTARAAAAKHAQDRAMGSSFFHEAPAAGNEGGYDD